MPRDNQSILPARESNVKIPQGTMELRKGVIKTLSSPHANLMSLSISVSLPSASPPPSSVKALPEPSCSLEGSTPPCPWTSYDEAQPICLWRWALLSSLPPGGDPGSDEACCRDPGFCPPAWFLMFGEATSQDWPPDKMSGFTW